MALEQIVLDYIRLEEINKSSQEGLYLAHLTRSVWLHYLVKSLAHSQRRQSGMNSLWDSLHCVCFCVVSSFWRFVGVCTIQLWLISVLWICSHFRDFVAFVCCTMAAERQNKLLLLLNVFLPASHMLAVTFTYMYKCKKTAVIYVMLTATHQKLHCLKWRYYRKTNRSRVSVTSRVHSQIQAGKSSCLLHRRWLHVYVAVFKIASESQPDVIYSSLRNCTR